MSWLFIISIGLISFGVAFLSSAGATKNELAVIFGVGAILIGISMLNELYEKHTTNDSEK